MKSETKHTITTFNLKIPGLETELPLCFSGTNQNEENWIQLKELNTDNRTFFSDLLVKSFEKKIGKKFEEYLLTNDLYPQVQDIERNEFKLEKDKSLQKLTIRSDERVKTFKLRLYRDMTDYFGDLNLTSMSKLMNYLIEKELKKQTKRDENREQP
jgi:hypothetical protein